MARWPLRTTYFWQEAPLFRPLLFLVAGIVCCDCVMFDKQSLPFFLCLFICSGTIVSTLAFIRARAAWMDTLYTLSFTLFFTALGWCTYAIATPGNSFEPKDGLTLVRIKAEPQTRTATTKLLVALMAEVNGERAKRIRGDALIYIYHKADTVSLSENDTLLLSSGWQAIRNRGNPFELNTADIQRRKGILLQQFLLPEDVRIFGKSGRGNKDFLNNAHSWCDKQLRTYIPDSATLGLLQAMLLGDESGFDPELRQAYSQTGVVHIVSISGSHVAVLYLVVTGLLFWMKGRRGSWVKLICSLLLVWLYVLIAGGPPSALRSALMFTVLALCTISEREGNSINTLSSAAVALLLYQPAWLFSVGFQLSFGAVLSIMIFYQPVYRLWYWPKKTKIGRMAWQAIAASLAAEVLTAPLVIYYFHNFPLLFLFANLLAAALAGFCALIGGMSIIALCWIPALARMLGGLVTWLVHLFNGCIVWMQGLNVPALQHLQINVVELLTIYFLIIGLSTWRLWQLRQGLLIALASACVLIAMLNFDEYKALRQERLIVYNNGREPAVDIIRGKHFKSIIGKGNDYNEKAAHIGYHAWRGSDANMQPLFIIGGKKVFIVTDSSQQSFANSLAVDVLVLARPLRLMRIGEALRAFTPKEVVLATRPSAYHFQRWQDSCFAHGIRLYNVAAKGAYISE